jgi:hypothetical protein
MREKISGWLKTGGVTLLSVQLFSAILFALSGVPAMGDYNYAFGSVAETIASISFFIGYFFCGLLGTILYIASRIVAPKKRRLSENGERQ